MVIRFHKPIWMHLKGMGKGKFIKTILRQTVLELDTMPSPHFSQPALYHLLWLGPILAHIIKSPVSTRILLSPFRYNLYPQYLTKFLSTTLGIYSSARILFSQFSQDHPHPLSLVLPLSDFPSTDPLPLFPGYKFLLAQAVFRIEPMWETYTEVFCSLIAIVLNKIHFYCFIIWLWFIIWQPYPFYKVCA